MENFLPGYKKLSHCKDQGYYSVKRVFANEKVNNGEDLENVTKKALREAGRELYVYHCYF
jgi:hypothetical protein